MRRVNCRRNSTKYIPSAFHEVPWIVSFEALKLEGAVEETRQVLILTGPVLLTLVVLFSFFHKSHI